MRSKQLRIKTGENIRSNQFRIKTGKPGGNNENMRSKQLRIKTGEQSTKNRDTGIQALKQGHRYDQFCQAWNFGQMVAG